jgi:rod shape-determining protein MreD
MSRLRIVAVLVAAVVVHRIVADVVTVGGTSPDTLLVVAAAAGLVGGPRRGAVIGFSAGLAADLFLLTPFGLAALVYCVVGYASGEFSGTVVRSARWIPLVAVSIAATLGQVLFAFAAATVGWGQLVSAKLPLAALTIGVLGGTLALAVTPAMAWAIRDRTRTSLR